MKFAIYPPEELIEEAVVTLPLSKSISTRALVFDALTQGVAACDSPGIAVCDDTAVITGALAVYAGANSRCELFKALGKLAKALASQTAPA